MYILLDRKKKGKKKKNKKKEKKKEDQYYLFRLSDTFSYAKTCQVEGEHPSLDAWDISKNFPLSFPKLLQV